MHGNAIGVLKFPRKFQEFLVVYSVSGGGGGEGKGEEEGRYHINNFIKLYNFSII